MELGQLQREKLELLLDLEDDEVRRYIISLSQSYYKAILKKDTLTIKSVIDSLNLIVDTFDDKYPDLSDFINYSFVTSSNNLFAKVFDLNCALWNPEEKSFAPDGLHKLGFTLGLSRLKMINDAQNIKEMYDIVINDDSIDNRIVEGISKLYFETRKYLGDDE